MKKHTFFVVFVTLTFLLQLMLLPMAIAATNYDPCKTGNHELVLIDIEYNGYGGINPFIVNNCIYASYPHRHYYITGSNILIYECIHCAYIEEKTVHYDDTELGQFCSLHDGGK